MKFLLSVLLALLLAGCTGGSMQNEGVLAAPDSLISEPVMVLILSDVHTIEAALQIRRNRGGETLRESAFYYAGLFQKYRISRQRYQQNLEYYRQDPDRFSKLYDKVNQELTRREKQFVKKLPG
jgi:hypothetical protein